MALQTRDSTDRLVKRFLRNPNDEASEFEAKSLRILETEQGRNKVVRALSTIANSGPGVLILGLGKVDGRPIVERLADGSEAVRDLMRLANRRTRPSVVPFLDPRVEEVEGGRIIRIDVSECDDGVIENLKNGDIWEAVHRVGSSTDVMSTQDIQRRIRRQLKSHEAQLLVIGRVSSKAVKQRRHIPDAPRQRAITETAEHMQPVFAGILPIEGIDRSCLYHFGGYSGALDTLEGWRKAIGLIDEHLSPLMDMELGYSIKVGRRVLQGFGPKPLLEDIAAIDRVAKNLMSRTPNAPASQDSRFLPLVTAWVPISGGLLWMQSEYQGGRDKWFRGQIGGVLEDIPFDPTPIRSVLHALGVVPHSYQQSRRTQGFRLHCFHPFGRPRLRPHSGPDGNFVEGDNPFYGRPELLELDGDANLPESFRQSLASMPRLVAQVRGGLRNDDRRFTLQSIEGIEVSLREETLLLHAMVSADTGRSALGEFDDLLGLGRVGKVRPLTPRKPAGAKRA